MNHRLIHIIIQKELVNLYLCFSPKAGVKGNGFHVGFATQSKNKKVTPVKSGAREGRVRGVS